MKKLLILLTCLFSISMFSQGGIYPRIEKDSLGQEFVVMTVKQAMTLDNNSDLLRLYEQLGVDVDNYENSCIKVINDQDKVIATLKLDVNNLKGQIAIKDEKIKTLQGEIADHVLKEAILKEQGQARQEIIDENTKQLRKLKTKMVVGGLGGGLIIIGLVAAILVN